MADVNVTTRLVGADQVVRGFQNVANTVKRVGVSLGALAGIASVGAFGAMAKSAIDTADQLAKMSQKVGVSVEDLSALSFQSKIAGSSIEEIGASLRFLNRAMDEAGQGVAEYAENFDRLGVAVKDSRGNLRPTIDVLEDVAESFSKMRDGAAKTAIASQILGRAGSNLIPMLNEGKAAFARYREEAERMGIIISTKTAKAAELFNDSMERTRTVLRGAVLQAITPFLEPMAQMAAKFAVATRESGYLQGMIQNMVNTFKVFAAVSATAYAALTIVGKSISAVAVGMAALVRGDFDSAKAVWDAWKEDATKAVGDLTDVFDVLFSKMTTGMNDQLKKLSDAMKGEGGAGGGADEYKKALEALNKELVKVKEEQIKLTQGEIAARRFALTQGSFAAATDAASNKIRDQIIALETLKLTMEAAKKEEEDLAKSRRQQMENVDAQIQTILDQKKAWEERAQALRETVDPLAVFNRKLAELNEIDMHVVGGLKEYDQILEVLHDELRRAIDAGEHLSRVDREQLEKKRELNKQYKETADALTRAANPMIAYTEAVRTYIELLNRGWITQETFNESVKASAETLKASLEKQKGEMEKWQEVMIENVKGFGNEFTRQLDAMLAKGENSWEEFRDAIFSLFRKSVLDAYITQPLTQAINDVIKATQTGGGGGGSGSNLIGQLGAAAAGYFTGQGMTGGTSPAARDFGGLPYAGPSAAGGVIPRGFVGLVGEEGPEMIAPLTSSRITPNNGGTIVINQTFQAGVSRAELAQILPRLKSETLAAVADAKLRGGSFSRTF